METTENTESTEDTESTSIPASRLPATGLLYEELTGKIRQTAYEIHCYFGPGFLEKVYENTLVNRLRKQELRVTSQVSLPVRDEDGTIVGQYIPDLVVDNKILVEIKATSSITPEHHAQTLNYLKVTGLRVGLLLNFGHSSLQVKRIVL